MDASAHNPARLPEPIWPAVIFPDAIRVSPGEGAVQERAAAVLPRIDARFLSPKDLRKIAANPNAAARAAELAAFAAVGETVWRERPPALSITAEVAHRNHLGFIFGGNIFDWSLRAAVSEARGALARHRGDVAAAVDHARVEFFAPIHVGDEVRAYVQCFHHPEPGSGSKLPQLSCSVSLVAHRAGGFAEGPLKQLEVARGQVTLQPYKAITNSDRSPEASKGLSIGPLLHNPRTRCEPTPFSSLESDDATLRRYAQLAAVADIRWYLAGLGALRMSETPHTVVTRDLSLSFSSPAELQSRSDHSLALNIVDVTRKRISAGKVLLRVHGAIACDGIQLMQGHASMVALGGPQVA